MNVPDIITELTNNILAGKDINYQQALELMDLPRESIYALLEAANRIRCYYKGNKLDLCSIINAKSGNCSEDCIFCAQSAHHKAESQTFPLVNIEKIIKAAQEAKHSGADRFGIVISGRCADTDKEIEKIAEAVKLIIADTGIGKAGLSPDGAVFDGESSISKENEDNKKNGDIAQNCREHISPCASLGILNSQQADLLKKAGLKRYHHNLETSEDFFPSICTTHSWGERVETVKLLKEKGFEVCSGGIFGLGEPPQERLKLAFTLKELDVDAVPLNFLYPVPGTPAENIPPLKPLEILKIIALYRFILPDKDIKICGGRETNLRDLQSLIFMAGANGMLMGGYLTTTGRSVEQDLQMLCDLELLA